MRWLLVLLIVTPFEVSWAQPRFKGERFPEDHFELPEPKLAGKPLRLWATWYRLHTTREAAEGLALLDLKGQPISRAIPEREFCRGAIAGAMRITERTGRSPRTVSSWEREKK
jgi:hypothetical protein